MKQENFEYLALSLKYGGFGEGLAGDLRDAMKEGKPQFTLAYSATHNNKAFEATLNFRKADNSDVYFFNSYRASLERSNGERLEQTFYLTKGKGVTGKEAFNLLDGRAVQKELTTKEGQPYKAWLQLETSGPKDEHKNYKVAQFHEAYGFDLKEALARLPLVDLGNADKTKGLIQSLERGNLQSVTLGKEGTTQKVFIEADPKYKGIKLYDEQLKPLNKETLAPYQSTQKNAPAPSVDNPVGGTKKAQEASLKAETKQTPVVSLLPKNRTGNGKGMNIA